MRVREWLKLILRVAFFVIFVLLYMIFRSSTGAVVLIFPTLYAMSAGLLLFIAVTSAAALLWRMSVDQDMSRAPNRCTLSGC